MIITSNIDNKKCIVVVECKAEEYDDVLSTVQDIQKEYAGFKSERQIKKQLMDDMESQIADGIDIKGLE